MFQDQQLPRIPGFVGVLRRYLGEIRDFSRIETGAVTVDWVVLTAATVGLGLASVAAVRSGTGSLGDAVGTTLSNADVASLSTPWPNAGVTNGVCPGEQALRQSHAELVAAGETFADLVAGDGAAAWEETPFYGWLREAEQNGFTADEFAVSYTWWQEGTCPGTPASREFTACLFACTLEASPTDWSAMPGGSLAGWMLYDLNFQMPEG
jgi:hypothetical protein